MKNQDFGDNRDLLKFDLVCEIVSKGLVDQFTYVPMLTKDEERTEEQSVCRHSAVGGISNKELVNFLDECTINEKRNIGQLEDFFRKCSIKAAIYGKDRIFDPEFHVPYFSQIPKALLTNALILIDPDQGLEENINGPGNLLFSDLRKIYDRMDESSVLMFTQLIPQGLYDDYLSMRTEDIKYQVPGSQTISIDDLDTLIFFLTKNQSVLKGLIQVLKDYTQQYAQKAE